VLDGREESTKGTWNLMPVKSNLEFINGSLNNPPDTMTVQESDLQRDRGQWFACERPESPRQRIYTAYHDCCRACLIAAQAEDLDIVPVMQERLETFGEAPA
jgi:hypothetical protein